MSEPKEHTCFSADCTNPAPYGYRWPGPMSELKPGDRGYLWACANHREDAERRRDDAMAQRGMLSRRKQEVD